MVFIQKGKVNKRNVKGISRDKSSISCMLYIAEANLKARVLLLPPKGNERRYYYTCFQLNPIKKKEE